MVSSSRNQVFSWTNALRNYEIVIGRKLLVSRRLMSLSHWRNKLKLRERNRKQLFLEDTTIVEHSFYIWFLMLCKSCQFLPLGLPLVPRLESPFNFSLSALLPSILSLRFAPTDSFFGLRFSSHLLAMIWADAAAAVESDLGRIVATCHALVWRRSMRLATSPSCNQCHWQVQHRGTYIGFLHLVILIQLMLICNTAI
jgi:hypothetical protein